MLLETANHPGFRVGRILEKMGQKGQDTCELFFDDVIVPPRNVLGGDEGRGFAQLMTELPYERTIVGVAGVACIEDLVAGRMDTVRASMAKYWITDLQCKIVDRCLQLFGGYGYMLEYPITQMYLDARVQRIYGGANEIMKEIIARSL
jgi:acyl-CoA dehydrogenase